MNTFTKEISYISLTLDENNPESGIWDEKSVVKTAVFSELSRREKKQHKLHFAIMSLFSSVGITESGDTKKINLDSDQIYDITVRAVKDLLIVDEFFTETDKKELLSDSGALIDFGFWLISEKLIPFFLILMRK